MPSKPVRDRLGDRHESRVHQKIQGGQDIGDRFQEFASLPILLANSNPRELEWFHLPVRRGFSLMEHVSSQSGKLRFRLPGRPLADGCEQLRSWHEPDQQRRCDDVRFSNRPFGVKHFQTIHQCDVDVARGLVLLFGIGTGAFPSWDSRTRRNNLLVGLAVEERRVQADIRTHLIHRPARDIFPPLGGALVFSYRVHAAAVACSLVQQNSVPSTHMRCMITASRRAKATIAFFIPRRLAICMAHALSQDHFFECIML